MILKKVRLCNMRSYVNETINFPEGIVLLSGDIGSGKSTVLLAIEFALFGLSRQNITGALLLRHGEKSGHVELHFSVKNRDVVVKRTLKRGQGIVQDSGYISIDSVRKDCTAIELKTIILGLLNYPKEFLTKSKDLIYRYTVYTPQEEMKHILLTDSTTRLETLGRVLGIDRYKRIRDNSRIVVQHLKERKREISGYILDLDEKLAQKKEMEDNLNALSARLRSLSSELDSVTKLLEAKKKEFNDAEIMVKKLHEIKNAVEREELNLKNKVDQQSKADEDTKNIEAEIVALVKETDGKTLEGLGSEILYNEKATSDVREKLRALENDMNRLRELQKGIELVEQDRDGRLAAIDKNRMEISGLLSTIITLEKALDGDDLELLIKSKETTISRLETDIKLISAKISELRARLANSEGIKLSILELDVCPVCMQRVNAKHKHSVNTAEEKNINEYKKSIAGYTNELNSLEKNLAKEKDDVRRLSKALITKQKIASLHENKENLLNKVKELEDNVKILDSRKMELESGAVRLKGVESSIKVLRDEFDLLSSKRSGLELIRLKLENLSEKNIRKGLLQKERAKILEDIRLIWLKKDSLLKELTNYADAEKKFERIKSGLEDITKMERELHISKASVEKEVLNIKGNISRLDSEIRDKREKVKELARISEFMDWIDSTFVGIINVMENMVMARMRADFNALFQKWFSMLVEDDITVNIDNTFTPLMEQNGHDIDYQHLSGGEKTAAALAYRLALNQAINNLNETINTKDLLILDEPTDGFSSEQLDKLRYVLEELAIKQIIIVSHEAKIESFVETVIRFQKENNISSVVRLL